MKETNIFEEEGFISHNNYKLLSCTEDKVELSVELTKKALNPYNIAHGGLIYGLADTAIGILVSYNKLPAVTLSSNINFIRPGIGTSIKAIAKIIKRGHKICFCKASIYNDKEELIATVDANYYIEDRKKD